MRFDPSLDLFEAGIEWKKLAFEFLRPLCYNRQVQGPLLPGSGGAIAR